MKRVVLVILLNIFFGIIAGATPPDKPLVGFKFTKSYRLLAERAERDKKDLFLIACKKQDSAEYDYFSVAAFIKINSALFRSFIMRKDCRFKLYRYERNKKSPKFIVDNFTLKAQSSFFTDFLTELQKNNAAFQDRQDLHDFIIFIEQLLHDVNDTPINDIPYCLELLKLDIALYYLALLNFPGYIDKSYYSQDFKKFLHERVQAIVDDIKKTGTAIGRSYADLLLYGLYEIKGQAKDHQDLLIDVLKEGGGASKRVRVLIPLIPSSVEVAASPSASVIVSEKIVTPTAVAQPIFNKNGEKSAPKDKPVGKKT